MYLNTTLPTSAGRTIDRISHILRFRYYLFYYPYSSYRISVLPDNESFGLLEQTMSASIADSRSKKKEFDSI